MLDEDVNEHVNEQVDEHDHNHVHDHPVIATTSSTVATASTTTTVRLNQYSKIMHHCSSSPDFRHYYELHNVVEEGNLDHTNDETNTCDIDTVLVHCTADDENTTTTSFTMVSDPSATTVKRVPSFRDALLLQKEEEEHKIASPHSQRHTTPPSPLPNQITPKKKNKKPTLVVTPIRLSQMRSCHSAGDLRSLGNIKEEHGDDIEGDTDAMDFYHRKSKGSTGRVNGMRLRPDEAKRRDIIVHKKNVQRQRKQG